MKLSRASLPKTHHIAALPRIQYVRSDFTSYPTRILFFSLLSGRSYPSSCCADPSPRRQHPQQHAEAAEQKGVDVLAPTSPPTSTILRKGPKKKVGATSHVADGPVTVHVAADEAMKKAPVANGSGGLFRYRAGWADDVGVADFLHIGVSRERGDSSA